MYLITKDYQRVIQTNELNAITGNDESVRKLVEGSVQIEMFANLMQRFDLSSEFTDTAKFDRSVIYKAANRIYLDAPAYSAATVYITNDLILQGGNVYISIAGSAAHAFNIAEWTLLGAQFDLFFLSLPFPLFSQDTVYQRFDSSFWKDKVYTIQRDSIIEDQQSALQAPAIEAINFGNTVPDDRINGKQIWGSGISFQGAAGLLPTNPLQVAWNSVTAYIIGNLVSIAGTNYIATGSSTNVIPGTNVAKWLPVMWTKGDNRNQFFIEIIMDVVVYKLCKRISPNNVPESRHNAWIKATKDIKAFGDGNLNAQLPIIQPKEGKRIAFGGKPFKDYDVW